MMTTRDLIMARYADPRGADPAHVGVLRNLAVRHKIPYPEETTFRVRAALRGDLEASLVKFRGVLNKLTDENYLRLRDDARAHFLPEHAEHFLAAIDTALRKQKGRLVRPLSDLAMELVGADGVRSAWDGEVLADELLQFRRGEEDIDSTEQYDAWCEYLAARLEMVNRVEAALRVGSLTPARVVDACADRLADRSQTAHVLMAHVAVAERLREAGVLSAADGKRLRDAVTRAPPAKPMIRFKVLDLL